MDSLISPKKDKIKLTKKSTSIKETTESLESENSVSETSEFEESFTSFSSHEISEENYMMGLEKRKATRRKNVLLRGITLNKFYMSDILVKDANIKKIFQNIRPDPVKGK